MTAMYLNERQCIEDDQQFTNWVEETIDDDFKYPSNFTTDYS